METSCRSVSLPPSLVAKCRNLVFTAANRYQVPPALITAHINEKRANVARAWVMQRMLVRLRMRRYQVAWLFQRDLRRVRRSVLGV
jgi:hypothetical protein